MSDESVDRSPFCPHCKEIVVPRFLRDAHVPMCARLSSLSADLAAEREKVKALGAQVELCQDSARRGWERAEDAEAQAAQWKAESERDRSELEGANSLCRMLEDDKARYRSALGKADEAMKLLVTEDKCRLDHSGNCQTHFVSNPCEMMLARKLWDEFVAALQEKP